MIEGEIRIAPSGGDDALVWQKAINQAKATGAKSGIEPVIAPAMGVYHFRTPLRWTAGHLVSPQVGQVRIVWDGPPDVVVITKVGGGSFFLLQGISLGAGATKPRTWLDFRQAGTMDVFGRLREVRLAGSTGDAIVVTNWCNLHWEHLRWDAIGGYAVRFAPHPSNYLSNLVIEQFTYDHQSDDKTSEGFLCFDTSETTSGAVGTVTLRDGRVEVNTAWVGKQALITHLRGRNTYGKVLKLSLENLTYYDIARMGTDCLYYLEATAPKRESLLLRNVHVGYASKVLGGNWPSDTSFPMPAGGYFAQTYFDGQRVQS
jgi:hypothetical protein